MYTLYSMQRSGNSYKVRLALAQLGIPYRLVEIDILQGRKPHAGIPRQESERPGAAARGRRRAASRRIERDPLVRRRRHAARARGPHRSRRGAAVDVLRAAQPGAQSRRCLFLARAGQGRARAAAARARGLDGGRLSRARRDGESPQAHRYFAAGRYTIADIALYAYTHLAHECDFDSRFPGDPRLARPRGGASPATCGWTGSRLPKPPSEFRRPVDVDTAMAVSGGRHAVWRRAARGRRPSRRFSIPASPSRARRFFIGNSFFLTTTTASTTMSWRCCAPPTRTPSFAPPR